MTFWRRRTREPDDADRDEAREQLQFARELALTTRTQPPPEGWVGPAVAAWFSETALYIEAALGEEMRDFFEASASVSGGRGALIDLYLDRLNRLLAQLPDSQLRFGGEELRAYGKRWRHDITERMSAGDRWSRSSAN